MSSLKIFWTAIGAFLALQGSYASAGQSGDASDAEEIQSCLRTWGHHPFDKTNLKFRTIAPKVRVLGVGDDLADTKATAAPELVLLKPAVNVLSKSVVKLMNPNGWYCLKGKVDVLGKTEIEIHCRARLASSRDGATVLGSNDSEIGVTVLGKSVVKRVGCKTEDDELEH